MAWTAVDLGAYKFVEMVQLDSGIMWAVSYYDLSYRQFTILRSKDGGKTWVEHWTAPNNYVFIKLDGTGKWAVVSFTTYSKSTYNYSGGAFYVALDQYGNSSEIRETLLAGYDRSVTSSYGALVSDGSAGTAVSYFAFPGAGNTRLLGFQKVNLSTGAIISASQTLLGASLSNVTPTYPEPGYSISTTRGGFVSTTSYGPSYQDGDGNTVADPVYLTYSHDTYSSTTLVGAYSSYSDSKVGYSTSFLMRKWIEFRGKLFMFNSQTGSGTSQGKLAYSYTNSATGMNVPNTSTIDINSYLTSGYAAMDAVSTDGYCLYVYFNRVYASSITQPIFYFYSYDGISWYYGGNVTANALSNAWAGSDSQRLVAPRYQYNASTTSGGNQVIAYAPMQSNYTGLTTIFHNLVYPVTVNAPPNAPVIAYPPTGTVMATRTPTIAWTFSDPDPGDYQGAFFMEIVNGTYSGVVWNSGWISSNAANYTIPAGVIPADGSYYIRMKVRDRNGVENKVNGAGPDPAYGGTGLVYIDTTPPWASYPDGTKYGNGGVRIHLYGVADNVSGVAMVYVWMQNPTNGGWLIEQQPCVNAGGGLWYYDFPTPADGFQGAHLVRFHVVDAVGFWSVAYDTYYVYDTIPPTFVGISPTTYTYQPTQRMYVTGVQDTNSGVQRVDAYIYKADRSAYYGPYTAVNDGGGTWHYDYDVSFEGNASHGIVFWAYDQAGNGSYLESTIYYDTVGPTITSVQGYSYTNQTSGTRRVWAYGITDATSGVAAVYCNYVRPDGSAVNSVPCNPSGSDYYADIPVTQDGEYRVDFYAHDRAGNWMSGPASKTAYFFVDTQRANDPNPSVVYGETTATISWGAISDPSPSSGYNHTELWLAKWNGTSWDDVYVGLVVSTSSSVSYEKYITGLLKGQRYMYTVAHYDNAGNQSAYTWREFITKKKIGEARISNSSTSLSLPVYDLTSGVSEPKSLRTATTAGTGCFELVSVNDVLASPLRVQTPQGVKAIAKL
ncbi:Ig-like domain repeat protein [Paenibacillus thalictri]|uniref:F5/8 type C domain-containing protein n=1 Tax=Paenibacillus thalictri TaxID=2527873 RepID=A0A4Q9DJW3_9BACL|nr:Ig-like domain repeat protein [Paenibacillus thalictri]TBL71368.1 hypothetical protein EYB31_30210 [Paenibacillus thalictri]